MSTNSSDFKAFLIASDLINRFDRSSRVFGPLEVEIHWTAWMDPGVHTGFAMVVYASIPGVETSDSATADRDVVEKHYRDAMTRIGIAGWHAEAGLPGQGTCDLVGSTVLAIHHELLTGDEVQQVRTAVGRIRQLGAIFAETTSWDMPFDAYDNDPHLGLAGIGAESFINLRNERDAAYLSPVRVRSMFQYALDDEFGVIMDSQQPGDAKTSFSDIRMKAAGLYVPGPDHVRDALAHALLAIRRNG